MIELIIPSLVSVVFSTFVAYWLRKIQKAAARRELREQRRQEREDEKERKRDTEHTALMCGLRAILRDRLITLLTEYERRGSITVQEWQNVNQLYTSYHDLGGNDIVTALYKNVQKLEHITDS